MLSQVDDSYEMISQPFQLSTDSSEPLASRAAERSDRRGHAHAFRLEAPGHVLITGPFALVAQLDRASVYGTESRRFESCRARRSGASAANGAQARSESELSSNRSVIFNEVEDYTEVDGARAASSTRSVQ